LDNRELLEVPDLRVPTVNPDHRDSLAQLELLDPPDNREHPEIPVPQVRLARVDLTEYKVLQGPVETRVVLEDLDLTDHPVHLE